MTRTVTMNCSCRNAMQLQTVARSCNCCMKLQLRKLTATVWIAKAAMTATIAMYLAAE